VRTAVQQLGGDVPPPLLGAAQAGHSQAPAPFAPQAAQGQPGQAQAAMPVANMDASQARAALSADPAKGQSVVIPMPGQAVPVQGAPAAGAVGAAGAGAGAAVAPAAAGNVSQTLYQKAMEAFRNRKYDDAQRMFGEFAATFKKDPLVPDAMAWRGDSLFQMGKYAEAVLIYDEIRSKFPKSNKVQPAMLKEGICLYKLGKKEAGKHLLKDLIRRYPTSPQAKAASNYIDTNG
jgi:tol-pal system protein YbgF